MNYTVVFFSFSGDAASLDVAIASVRKNLSNAKIVVVDDANSPLNTPPNADHYMLSTFDRRGNLNGYECIKGLLETYIKVAELYPCDYLIKIDCDTIFQSDFFIKKNHAMCGLSLGNGYDFCWGHCYAIAPGSIDKVYKLLLTKNIKDRIEAQEQQPEDRLISNLFRLVHGHDRVSIIDTSNINTAGRMTYTWYYRDPSVNNLKLLRRAPNVTFGHRKNMPDHLSPQEKRDLQALTMYNYFYNINQGE